MQKACGIIAISAIALSASQFASAQTSSPDRSARTADQSSAAREAVKSTLRDAGFTNVRIMSDIFFGACDRPKRRSGRDGGPPGFAGDHARGIRRA